jgi:hypothetical protein
MELRHDGDILALDVLPVAPSTSHSKRPVRKTNPDPGDADHQEQTGGDRIERPGPERPGGEVDPEAEREDHPTAPSEH